MGVAVQRAGPTITIGGQTIGGGHPCFVVAEAGSNHNGSLEQAVRLIEVAADAGADAVKFQLFRASRMYPRSAGTSDYLKSETPIYEIIAAMEMPYEWLPALVEHCARRRIMFLATPFDEESVDRLDPWVAAFKIASYEMTHLPFVRHVAAKGKPMIVSTGTASLREVAVTVDACRETGNTALALLQCTAAYPAPLDSINVRAMATLAEQFHVPVGLSDHSRDPVVAPVAAVACGAAIVEKHFTLSNDLPGPDHRFALEPAELGLMVDKIRAAEQVLGTGDKLMAPIESELHAFARRSVFAIRRIAAGETFSRENIAVLRCGKRPAGLPPAEFPTVLGRRAPHDIMADSSIRAEDVV
jgi:sialic acid synthase SpsE